MFLSKKPGHSFEGRAPATDNVSSSYCPTVTGPADARIVSDFEIVGISGVLPERTITLPPTSTVLTPSAKVSKGHHGVPSPTPA